MAVKDLPKNVSYSVDPTVKYSFRAQHLPENDNYSHTAVVIDKEEKEMKKFKSTDKHEILKRNLREEIALRLRLYRPGNIDSPAHTAEKSII
ncbi:hypothetical protein AYO43_09750 [Nitrospira sp. SCGC AG-212-E16]|nr:hypothetical protein AYO43_09750 [Nitrospira sp. SCGC AG-212-E16]